MFQERASGFGGLILGKSLVMRYVMGHRRSTEQCVSARLYALGVFLRRVVLNNN